MAAGAVTETIATIASAASTPRKSVRFRRIAPPPLGRPSMRLPYSPSLANATTVARFVSSAHPLISTVFGF